MSAYQLNKLLYNLRDAEKVRTLVANETELDSQFRLTLEEIEALRSEDIGRLYHLGVNPYLIRLVYRGKFEY